MKENLNCTESAAVADDVDIAFASVAYAATRQGKLGMVRVLVPRNGTASKKRRALI